MSAAFVPEVDVGVYGAIARYLSEKLGRPVDFVSGLSYGTIGEMIDAGVVQLAFLCGLPYVLKTDTPTPTVRLVAAPVMTGAHYGGEPKYFSYVIVRQGLAARSFADLRGLRFAYNEELSNSGYNMPRAKLVELGETHGFFGSTVRSGSHEESIRMVADGKADAACVDSLVFDYQQERGAPQVNRVRVIERLGPAGIPLLVASTHLDEDLCKQVRDVLLCMDEDDAGRRILAEAFIARFVAVEDSNYEDIRRMWQAAKSAGFLKIQ
jgi:phosphonate transport system substrate-binding protein